jgi:hypothetical protein
MRLAEHVSPRTRRLRSQLSRTPEWGSLDERARVARMCDGGGPDLARLAAALRSRHCAELRKGDLMFLARMWGYKSDVWSRRKDRRYAQRADGAPPPPLPVSAQMHTHVMSGPGAPHALQLAGGTASGSTAAWDRFAAEPPSVQLAAVHSQLAGPLRVLAERSIAAFTITDGISERLLALHARSGAAALPPAVLALAADTLGDSRKHLQVAVDAMRRLLTAMRQQHADIQLALLRMPQGDGMRPAWIVMGGKEPPWEALLRDLAVLADFAICCGKQARLAEVEAVAGGCDARGGAAAADVVSSSDSDTAAAAATPSDSTAVVAAGAQRQAAAAPDVPPELLDSLFTDPKNNVRAGGTLALELTTRIASMLAQLKLATHEAYLNAASLSLGLLIGHLTAVAAALTAHQERVSAAGRVLIAAGARLPANAAF